MGRSKMIIYIGFLKVFKICRILVVSSFKSNYYLSFLGQIIYKNSFLLYFQAYRSPDSHLVRLFCCGFYEEIVIMDPMTLSLVYTLSSRINPDWISAFHVLRPRNRNDDVVLALTTTGTVKVINICNFVF